METETRLELFAETIVETDEPTLPHLRTAKLIAVTATLDAAAVAAVAHASGNFDDGDYHVQNEEGRVVARIAVRAGLPRIEPVTGALTAAEALDQMREACPFCPRREFLIPCGRCDARRCACCLALRVCCNPNGDPPVYLDP